MNSINSLAGAVGPHQTTLDLQASQLKQAQQTNSQFEQLKQQLESGNVSSQQASNNVSGSIDKAAADFESVFISMILKSMRSTLDQTEGGLFAGDNSDTFGGMFDMFMSKHLSETSPIGVGSAIKNYLANQLQSAGENHESDPDDPAEITAPVDQTTAVSS